MYKLLLSWRYLKTRFIALASIVSVTLGVATLIVVNSVMAGFVTQMKDRLHGILSDVEVTKPGIAVIENPEFRLHEIEELVGDDLEAVTYVVRVPAFMNFEYMGRQFNQHIVLMGIDEKSFANVTDFIPFLQNENKANEITFTLEEDGYDAEMGPAGWPYRRTKVENQRAIEEMVQRHRQQYGSYEYPGQSNDLERYDELQRFDVVQTSYNGTEETPGAWDSTAASSTAANDAPMSGPVRPTQAANPAQAATPAQSGGMNFAPLPDKAPDVTAVLARQAEERAQRLKENRGEPQLTPFDPHAHLRPELDPSELFDPARDQHIGIILGKAIAVRKALDENGDSHDVFMLRPGDDVNITAPTAGSPPSAVMENCTVVDFYNSNMYEYDSSFAFMPLKEMQKLRGMIDPVSGASSVSSIQIKTRPGADLSAIRDKLNAHYAANNDYDFVVQTWQDTQRPLLSAVNMELTILNILLFMIIAVAGFGILATFFMIVVEKTKDIGILKALGAPSRGVMSIFLGYGLSLGMVGTGVGIVIGLLFVANINRIAGWIQVITGQEVFDPSIYYFSEIPTIVNPMMVVLVAIGAIAIAVLASVLPALRAARLHPVEALRYE